MPDHIAVHLTMHILSSGLLWQLVDFRSRQSWRRSVRMLTTTTRMAPTRTNCGGSWRRSSARPTNTSSSCSGRNERRKDTRSNCPRSPNYPEAPSTASYFALHPDCVHLLPTFPFDRLLALGGIGRTGLKIEDQWPQSIRLPALGWLSGTGLKTEGQWPQSTDFQPP